MSNYTITTTHGAYRLTGCTQYRWTLGILGPRRLLIGNAQDKVIFMAPAAEVLSVTQDDHLLEYTP
ncbi:DNA Polymerase-binding protein [Pseudomonas phage LKA1]|uniref:DNA Polymerase-binding protein n=1 Tax=Pseudomonas phage LKA1 TaxID=386793 RepID=A0A090LX43_9CAUD|nr:DNA Polymerase-binding protein [Pseudomonas phage LKA1]CEF82748.1 DNA Polymerase-binding protein [Pseudomonas phage LKA1]